MISAIRIPNLAKESPRQTLELEGISGVIQIPNTLSFTEDDKELADLPDRRAYRAMSRASILISAVGLEIAPTILPYIKSDPSSVGIYCALNNGPEDYACAKELIGISDDDFHGQYKRLRNPKHYLKQLPNLAPAQLGIFLGAFGPTNTYSHSEQGSIQALDHAKFDLRTKKVKAALVCSAFAHEDSLLSLRSRISLNPDTVLSEGAGAVLLTEGELTQSCEFNQPSVQNNDFIFSFGIADPLIRFIVKGI